MADTLHALSPALAGRWERASTRERGLVVAAIVVTAFAAGYSWVWQPMTADVERLQRDLPRERSVLAAARAQADALVALQRATTPVKSGDPRAGVERILAERGLRPAVASIELSEGRVRIAFSAVRFDALPGLLDALAIAEALYVTDAVVTARVEPGTVRAEITLSR
ncbi:MAG: type II secretion system protein GspM [Burkholderiales bacterium]